MWKKLKEGFDEFGNPIGKAFDLGGMDDDRLRGEKYYFMLVILMSHTNGILPQQSVSERNMRMDIVYRGQYGKCPIDERMLSKYQQLWMVSDISLTMSAKQVDMICSFAKNGGGVLLWADNDPVFWRRKCGCAKINGYIFFRKSAGRENNDIWRKSFTRTFY